MKAFRDHRRVGRRAELFGLHGFRCQGLHHIQIAALCDCLGKRVQTLHHYSAVASLASQIPRRAAGILGRLQLARLHGSVVTLELPPLCFRQLQMDSDPPDGKHLAPGAIHQGLRQRQFRASPIALIQQPLAFHLIV